jgi:hypothetical protein
MLNLLQQKHWQNILIFLTLLLRIPKFYNCVNIHATSSDQFSVRRESRNIAWFCLLLTRKHTCCQLL